MQSSKYSSLVLLLFLSDVSPTSLLRVQSGPGSPVVDWESSPGHLTGGQGGRVRGEETQSGDGGPDLLHGPVSELVHPHQVSLETSSVLIIVVLSRNKISSSTNY